MTMPQGRLHNPDSPQQEVLANGAVCGNALRELARIYWGYESLGTAEPRSAVHYPLDYFGEDEEPVKSPITGMTMLYGAEDMPLLAWAVAPGGGTAAIVVDKVERPTRVGVPDERGQPVTYTDCQLIQGTPSEVLPREILEKMRLR
jgi:hypothetical protein